MRPILPLVFLLFVLGVSGQARKIDASDYKGAFTFAVSETNKAYPVIFTVVTTEFEKGKAIRTITEVNENEAPGHHRTMTTTTVKGRRTTVHQISVGFGKNYCSEDGLKWKPSEYECLGPSMFYGMRDVESVEYSVTEEKEGGKNVKVYREYRILAPSEGSNLKEFREKIAIIDSRGFFISVEDSEGTIGPKTVTLTRKQSWVTNAKIKPVVAPVAESLVQ